MLNVKRHYVECRYAECCSAIFSFKCIIVASFVRIDI
jgi:hypothetical protein